MINVFTKPTGNLQPRKSDDLSLGKVLQTIINTVGQILDVDLCILRGFQEEKLLDNLIYRKPENQLARLKNSDAEELLQLVWKTKSVIVIDNMATDLDFLEEEERKQAYQKLGIYSALLIPLILQQELIAVIGLYRCQEAHSWRENEIQLAMMVADQAVLAISQSQAYQQVHALAQRESLINAITSAIRSSLDPEAIFTAITQQLGQVLDVDGCALSLWNQRDEFVQCVGLYDRYQPEIETLPQSVVAIAQNPVLQQLLETSQPVVLEDMENYGKMNQFDLPLRLSAKALLIVPLIVEGEIIGSISLRQTTHPRHWYPSQIDLAQAVASQAAIAVQQARLYETTKQQAERLLASEQRVKQLNNYLTESVLKRFLPAAIVNKVAAGELVLDLSPEPRLVTILFSDMVGFTPLASQLGPQLVAMLLNEYLEVMTQAVFEHGGTVDKFIGDAIVALFGAPEELSPDEQVRRAIAVAKAMYYYLAELNQRWQSKGLIGGNGLPLVRFRCGIAQGNAVVGMFGGGQRSDYTAIGPAVNMAARLQEASDANTILVSATVASYLPKQEIKPVKPLQLKGIAEEVAAFSVAIYSYQ